MKKIKYTKKDLSAVLQQLNNIHREKIKSQNDAIFIKFDWLDLSKVEESDDEFFNLGVREETPQQFNDRVNSLMNSYDDLGWDTSFFPPCVGLNGKPRDGRGRIISAKRYGYDKIIKKLKNRNFSTGIITNFDSDGNSLSKSLNLPNLIDHVITSKDAGASKPSKKIFDHSLKIMKINAENCVFVGDQIDTDIIGAQNANIKPILIDRENLYSEYKDCVVINNLNELLDVINL